ncbi:MAG: anion permease [Acidobacteria bacterium]|nr:MAG: anion permease [Acidobacteriota bacterium]
MEVLGLGLVVALALAFAVTNGVKDTGNAIATSVASRALTPLVAVRTATVANLVGAFLGLGIVEVLSDEIVAQPTGTGGLVVIGSALAATIVWNLLTWWQGLPTSSTHAMIGGLVGAALVGGVPVLWERFTVSVLLPLLLSPVVGFLLAYAVLHLVMRVCRHRRPDRVDRGFRVLQTGSAATLALGHGLQDAPKAMAFMVLALEAAGRHSGEQVPFWVAAAAAVALALGTSLGGWRIVRTLGRGLARVDPPRGFAAESTAAAVLYVGGLGFSMPLSTTHTIAAALTGVGVVRGRHGVRWRVFNDIAAAWLLTVPATGVMAALLAWGLGALL